MTLMNRIFIIPIILSLSMEPLALNAMQQDGELLDVQVQLFKKNQNDTQDTLLMSSREVYPAKKGDAWSYTGLLKYVETNHCFHIISPLITVNHTAKLITISCTTIVLDTTPSTTIPVKKSVSFDGTMQDDLPHDCYIKIASSPIALIDR